MANLQKNNLCLEAENLELKMDLEKYSKETPHLQEQIQHLERYILYHNVLKILVRFQINLFQLYPTT